MEDDGGVDMLAVAVPFALEFLTTCTRGLAELLPTASDTTKLPVSHIWIK